MPNTIEQVEQYARAHPTRDGESWNNWCESLIWRAGGFGPSFNSAMLAGDASEPLNPNWREAPRGAIHYWAGVGGDGHVAFELGGGLLLMASSYVTDSWGDHIGTVSFEDYAEHGIPYRGWSLRHGTETLAPSAPTLASVEAATALPLLPEPQPEPPTRKQDNMRFAYIPNGAPNGKDHLFIEYGPGFYHEWTGQESADILAAQYGGKAMPVNRTWANETQSASTGKPATYGKK